MFRSLFASVHIYSYAILLIVIAALISSNYVLLAKNERLQYDLFIQEEKFLILEQESELHKRSVELASNEAILTINRSKEEALLILDEKIAIDCEGAIDWGIEQALKI